MAGKQLGTPHLSAAAIAGVIVPAALPEAAAACAEVVAAVRLARPLRQPRRLPVLVPLPAAAGPVQPQPPHRPCNHAFARQLVSSESTEIRPPYGRREI